MDPAEQMYQKFLSLQQPILKAATQGDSEIQRFYEDSTVLVTGGTGFLGKILIEKLIRSCKIKKIYVLIREKKGKHTSDRIADFLKDTIFDGMLSNQPDFGRAVVPVKGDVTEMALGLSDQDSDIIKETVDVIYHLAATTKFDEALSKATLINVRGTREVVNLAKQCKKLKCLVHVSTAYTHATRSRVNSQILEKFYRSPINAEVLIGMAESMDEDRLVAVTEKLIDDWPNTYTFTKAVAEEIVRVNAEDLPVCIIRPPIVMPSYLEPLPGRTDPSRMQPTVGIGVTSLLGLVHVYIFGDVTMNLAPVDFVANAVIVSAYTTEVNHDAGYKGTKIYTLTSGDKFRFSKMNQILSTEKVLKTPQCIWYSCLYQTTSWFVYWLLTWLFHYIPGYILDAALFILRLKKPQGMPSFVKLYKKVYSTSQILAYFTLNQWHWSDFNLVRMYKNMSQTDKDLFNFDIASVDDTNASMIWILGARKYILKDGLKNTATGLRKQFWFKIATYIILPIYAFLVFYVIYWIYTSIIFFIITLNL